MSTWSDVGDWLEKNAGSGASLVGSLLTGNIPGAVAAGVALVASATGQADPEKALQDLQQDPQTLVKLRELAKEERNSIRKHLEVMTQLQLQDAQSEQAETQKTVRAGDVAEDKVVRRTRPLQSWLSLVAAICYVFLVVVQREKPDGYVLGLLLTLPWSYAGLRQIGKGFDSVVLKRKAA